MTSARAQVVSSFTIIKGALIEETYAAFRDWDFSLSKRANLDRVEERDLLGAASRNWVRDVRKVLNRRFDPAGRDRPLVELAKSDCERSVWSPLVLWHMTRDEFLLRDFLGEWLYEQYVDGAYRLRPDDVLPYLRALPAKKDVIWSGAWSPATTMRVASGLLRIAADFGLLRGGVVKEFAFFHLPDASFLYLLYAICERESSAGRVIASRDWRLFLMDSGDVERELLRLHQFHKLQYEAAGSLVRLDLPATSLAAYVRSLAA